MLQRPIGHRQVLDINGQTINLIDPNHKPSIFDPGSEFIKQLELYKIKNDIKPRKVNMMQSQIGMIKDFCSEDKAKKLYVPMDKGFVK